MYLLLRLVLFCFPAEFSHNLGLKGLALLHRVGLSGLIKAVKPENPVAVQALGLTFDNPVGLAAGLDKNGDYIDALGSLGFGFIEVGTITPKPQSGNPKPRLFRLRSDQAIINRMGFNNKGVEHLVQKLKARKYTGLIGVNIGKNLSTAVEAAEDDYLICLKAVYDFCDYIVVNLSSPNTPGLRSLQFGEHLNNLLSLLKQEQLKLEKEHGRYVPMLIKVAPDMDDEEIKEVAQALIEHQMDGVSATNTTISREGLKNSAMSKQAGGLSGQPVCEKSLHVIAQFHLHLKNQIPIIGIGGIHDHQSAKAKRIAGATLLQVYTGFIYQGPNLISAAINGYRAGRN